MNKTRWITVNFMMIWSASASTRLFSTAAALVFAASCQSPKPAKTPLPAATKLASIAIKSGDGSTLILADRSSWTIRPDDQLRILSWQAGDIVEARNTARAEYPTTLTNVEEGASVRAEPGEPYDP